MENQTQPYNVVANRAAEYLRYSSDGQNEATISAQRRIVKTYADTEGYNIVKSYVDEAETATTSDNRDAFLQMLSDAKKGYFDYIIVWQFSRFARNKEESVIYKAMLRKIGVRVISATEKTDDTLFIDGSSLDMYQTAVTIRHIYTTEVTASFDEATKKRYTQYDPDYHLYSSQRREYRQAVKAGISTKGMLSKTK